MCRKLTKFFPIEFGYQRITENNDIISFANTASNDTSSDTGTISRPADQASSEIDTGADESDMELSMIHPGETAAEKVSIGCIAWIAYTEYRR